MSSQSAGIPCTHPKGLQEWSRGTEDIWEKQAAARCYWENGETEMQTLPWSQASIASTWGQFLVVGQMKHSRIGSLYVGFLIQIIISLLVTSTSKTKANLSQTFFFFCHFRSVSPVGICIWKIVFELILSLNVSISTYFFNTFFFPPKKKLWLQQPGRGIFPLFSTSWTSTARSCKCLGWTVGALVHRWGVVDIWGFRWSDVGVIKVKVYHSWWMLIS